MIIVAALLDLPISWRLWVFVEACDLLDIVVKLLFPEWKVTPKGNENARR